MCLPHRDQATFWSFLSKHVDCCLDASNFCLKIFRIRHQPFLNFVELLDGLTKGGCQFRIFLCFTIAYPPIPNTATGAANTAMPATIPPPTIDPAVASPEVMPAADTPVVPSV